jgi:hypothetical protein
MPIDIRVDSAERVRYSVATGVVTDRDMIDAYERVVGDPAFDPTLKVLADIRGLERAEITADGIRDVAERRARDQRALGHPPRVAIVVASDVTFGLARMYEAYSDQQGEDKRYLVCRSMDEARRWLGIAAP